MIPRATYRLQFHRDFPFDRAAALVPYLDRLGISHVYASPITTARSGSTHGYDVVDATAINPELGGEAGFRALAAALQARGMGLIIDIVPNHMGVAGGENRWWNDVLAHGPASRHAGFFDIDWRHPVLLPVLGGPLGTALNSGAIRLDHGADGFRLLLYGRHPLPLRPEDRATLEGLGPSHALSLHDPAGTAGRDRLGRLLSRQHYRLTRWQTADDELNWRRFFTVSDLAGLRMEDPLVFEAVHALPLRLWDQGLIDGLRIDHVDGLSDPAAYCRQLHARMAAAGRRPYVVVEKILAADEPLAADWMVDGTTGYDFMAQCTAVLHDPVGARPLGQLWERLTGRRSAFAAEERRARRDMVGWAFEGQLSACVEAFHRLATSRAAPDEITVGMLRRALSTLLLMFPVYRTYATLHSSPAADQPILAHAREAVAPLVAPGEARVMDAVLGWLGGTGGGDPLLRAEAVRRFQQLSAPVAAKSVEDMAFYRAGRLLSVNDVGSNAARIGLAVPEFHAAAAARARDFPHALLAIATHDHKRGADVRARLAVLSERADAYAAQIETWEAAFAGGIGADLDAADRLMLYQTLIGVWPDGLGADDAAGIAALTDRVAGFQQKALREARLRSSWEAPDSAYEAAADRFVRQLLDPEAAIPFLSELAGFVATLRAPARANSLVQAALHCLTPGVPDIYQGTELADFSLVDPDNRRPVDFARLAQALDASAPDDPFAPPVRLHLVRDLLGLRRAHPALFADSCYAAAAVSGPRADHVLAFRRIGRSEELRVAVALRLAGALEGTDTRIVPEPQWWDGTSVDFGTGAVAAAMLFTRLPLAVELRPRT
jgi:(1->4)-alpha-D-glucan 1-alpha-D-glucosylmutase